MARKTVTAGYSMLTSLLHFSRSSTAASALAGSLSRGGPFAPEMALTGTAVNMDSQQRCFARQRATEGIEHLLAKKAFGSALSDLRKQWEGERKKALILQKHRQEAAKLRQERFVERRRKLRAERQAAQAEARAKFDERKRNRQALAYEEGARWREALQGIYGDYREQRRDVLLEQSKNWIRAEDLDMRIEEALDNPVPLAVAK